MNQLGSPFDLYPNPPPALPKKKLCVIRAGVICIIFGFLTFWMLGLGMVFFSTASILGIIGVCKDRVGEGLVVFFGAIFSMALCYLILVGLFVGATVAVVAPAVSKNSKVLSSTLWPSQSAASSPTYSGVLPKLPPRPPRPSVQSPQAADLLKFGSDQVKKAITPVFDEHAKNIRQKRVDLQTSKRQEELQKLRAKQGNDLR